MPGLSAAYPSYEQRNEEKQGDFRITPRGSVGLQGSVVLITLRRHPASSVFGGARRYVHGVLLVVLAGSGGSGALSPVTRYVSIR